MNESKVIKFGVSNISFCLIYQEKAITLKKEINICIVFVQYLLTRHKMKDYLALISPPICVPNSYLHLSCVM